MTNSRIKFIIVVDASNTALRENDVRTVIQWKVSEIRQLVANAGSQYLDVPESSFDLYGCSVQSILCARRAARIEVSQ